MTIKSTPPELGMLKRERSERFYSLVANGMLMLYGKYFLIKMYFKNMSPPLYMHPDFRCSED